MATMEIIKSDCHEPKCKSRATRRVRGANGTIAGDFCAKHGDKHLVALGKLEGEEGRKP